MKTLAMPFLLMFVLVACSPTTEAPTTSGEPPAVGAAKVATRDVVVAPKAVEIPSGTEISVILIDALSSDKSAAGDVFNATLAAPIVVGGQTVLDRGVKVQGKVVDAEGSGRVKGQASMRLVLTGMTIGNKTIPIVTETFFTEAEATKGRDAAVVGGGAGIGAAIGAIAGGKDGAAKGAVIGTAAGAGTVLATKGKEVEFPSESRLTFTLKGAVSAPRG